MRTLTNSHWLLPLAVLVWTVLGVSLLSTASFATEVDTLLVYGGPSSLEGKFEDAESMPDWQGWTSVDLTQPTTSYWHIHTYHCANLDSSVDPNHAWWCGEYFVDDCTPGDFAGYGNNYREFLDWYGAVTDPISSVIVTVSAALNYDNEPGYDFLYFGHEVATGMVQDMVYNGTADSVAFWVTLSVLPEDYIGANGDQVHLRWWFESDGGWSDEDCLWPTLGAAQIDLIEVYFDQGAGPVQIGETENCEPGDPVQWELAFPQGVGDFAHVWPLLDDIDPVVDNLTPQVAFIDDGVMVPGTGGTICTTWCYGPGGYCVNTQGGLAGPEFHLDNEIRSPVIAWPEGDYDGGMLSFGVFRHETLSYNSPYIFYKWRVRSTDDPAGGEGWTEWRDRNIAYWGGPEFVRHHEGISDLLLPACRHVQIALGLWELGWNWLPVDPTPAPYFDNVALRAYASDIVAVRDAPDTPVRDLTLTAAPNPFNPVTEITFSLPRSGHTRLEIHDLRGRRIAILADGLCPAGEHHVRWHARDEHGAAVASGVYYAKLIYEAEVRVKKITLLR